MATVTRQFKQNFDEWAKHRIASGDWSPDDIEELRGLLRIDLTPGPDQLRAGLTFIKDAGIEVPATIDDHEERYRLWDNFFANENRLIGAQA